MSAAEQVSVEVEPEYLDTHGIAARYGLKIESVRAYNARGTMPEPDLVWLGKSLWLVSTADAWRRDVERGRRSGARKVRRHRTRQERVRTEPRPLPKPPKLAKPPAAAAPAAAPNRRLAKASSRTAARTPVAALTDSAAAMIAAALRGEGHYCTTADALELAGAEPLEEHERELLRQRVVAKVRALKH